MINYLTRLVLGSINKNIRILKFLCVYMCAHTHRLVLQVLMDEFFSHINFFVLILVMDHTTY